MQICRKILIGSQKGWYYSCITLQAETLNPFKNRLNKHWTNNEEIYNPSCQWRKKCHSERYTGMEPTLPRPVQVQEQVSKYIQTWVLCLKASHQIWKLELKNVSNCRRIHRFWKYAILRPSCSVSMATGWPKSLFLDFLTF